MKVDIVMWAKNGERHLAKVLNRIETAIPSENVHRKILVDDGSIDRTVEIAKDFGWEIYRNPKGGIPSGANEALRHVDCEQFISIEQDVVLANDWWSKIPHLLDGEKVVVAQGIRLDTEPTLRKIQEYSCKTGRGIEFSLDNNIYQTKVIKQLGGFPCECLQCCDRILYRRVIASGFRWAIDRSVISDHVRANVSDFILHDYNAAKRCSRRTPDCAYWSRSLLHEIRMFLASPIRGSIIAFSEKCPRALLIYPRIRLAYLKSRVCYVKRKRKENEAV